MVMAMVSLPSVVGTDIDADIDSRGGR